MRIRQLLGAALACATLSIAAQVSPAAEWTLTPLGKLPSPYNVWAAGMAINESGQVVGYSGTSSNFIPVLFDNNGNAVDLGNLGAVHSDAKRGTPQATGINNNGMIVGTSPVADGKVHAFTYTNGSMTDLGALGGGYSEAFAVNDAGTVVGRSIIDPQDINSARAFVYSNGTMTDIGGIGAMDVNQQGQVVGFLNYQGDAFLYENGVMHNIGKPTPNGVAIPWAINDRSRIVGEVFDNNTLEQRAGYYDGGTWHTLGVLGSPAGGEIWETGSSANDVNNRNQIVGASSFDSGNGKTGFIYANGAMHDLNSLIDPNSGFQILTAGAINDRGQIVGSMRGSGSGSYAYLLTPTLDTFELNVTYANPLLLGGDSGNLPDEITVKFMLEGIEGMTGDFLQQDILSAMIELEPGVWTTVSPTDFLMTMGSGGLTDITGLSYNLGTLEMPNGWQLTLHNNSFQLYATGTDPTGQTFSYQYVDSMQDLELVPEPSTLVLGTVAAIALCFASRRARKSRRQ